MHDFARSTLRGIARLCTLSCVLACAPGAALAQVEIAAGIANLRYTVADLDPADGIGATLTLHDWPGLPAVSGDIYGWHDSSNDFSDYGFLTDNVHANSLSLAWAPMASFTASFSGRETLSTIRGDVAITAAPAIPGQSVQARADVKPAEVYFQLSPMSSMTVQVDATLRLSAGHQEGVAQYGGGGVLLSVGPTWFPGDYESVTDRLEERVGTYFGDTWPDNADLARTLTVTLVNDSVGEWKSGAIYLGAGGTAYIASAVPEAHAWQLLAAGLVLLPAWMRRTRGIRAGRS